VAVRNNELSPAIHFCITHPLSQLSSNPFPQKARILLVEGKRPDRPSFSIGLAKKGFEVETVTAGNAALACMALFAPTMIIVDAASMRTSGRRICNAIRQADARLPIILIVGQDYSENQTGNANVVLGWPCTLQKLFNRMRTFLPADEKTIYCRGPIRLDLQGRRVDCLGAQASLTPVLVRLLKILMDHAGEVIGRRELFRRVWDTEFTADTRTLDVHISWLRQAIEIDPHEPRFLKTVRGVGYRLDM
jgi:DNA-binding response OmpR family regulator